MSINNLTLDTILRLQEGLVHAFGRDLGTHGLTRSRIAVMEDYLFMIAICIVWLLVGDNLLHVAELAV